MGKQAKGMLNGQFTGKAGCGFAKACGYAKAGGLKGLEALVSAMRLFIFP